jgi:hypothetical protein
MNRSILKYLIPFVLTCVPAIAGAAPGYSLTTLTVLPANLPKVIAATDKMMASATGQKFKGRLLLLQHIADGSDPASISIVSIYKSAAELEVYGNLMQDDPARMEYLNTVVPIAQLQLTARTTTIRSWGDINDTDTIWVGHYLIVKDLPALMAAMDAWQNSPMGKKFPGQGHLSAITFGGAAPGTPTHVVSLGYASIAEMESYNDMTAKDPDWAKFLAAVAPASTHVGADLSRTLKTWGTASIKSLVLP